MSLGSSWLPFLPLVLGPLLFVRCTVAVFDGYSEQETPQTTLGVAFCELERALLDPHWLKLEEKLRASVKVNSDGTIAEGARALPPGWIKVCVAEFGSGGIRNAPIDKLRWPACAGYEYDRVTLLFVSMTGEVVALRMSRKVDLPLISDDCGTGEGSPPKR